MEQNRRTSEPFGFHIDTNQNTKEERIMATATATMWLGINKGRVRDFKEFTAVRLEDSILGGLLEALKHHAAAGGGSVPMPWGTFTVEVGKAIECSFEPTKKFVKMITDEESELEPEDYLTKFDEKFSEAFDNIVRYGDVKGEDPENPQAIGYKLTEDQKEYLINDYTRVLATMARNHQHPGKIYPLNIDDAYYPHGRYDFEWSENAAGELKVTVTFTPSKPFKQELKNDDLVTATA